MSNGSAASQEFDVVIMGGGPGGSTLGAVLARRTGLKIGLYEKSNFPREHIGESLIARSTVLLERSGALPKVLASDCWLRKEGGFFDWNPGEDPYMMLFSDREYQRDKIARWALHVNRSEFDAILLDHARASGVTVVEGTGVASVERRQGLTHVRLDDGSEVSCRVFVDASGRHTSVVGVPRAYLSGYRNIAIWNHFVGARAAQSLPGDWNVFRDNDWTPIGNFACDDGWFWYIPVRKLVGGERITTHSLGLVTDPAVLKLPGKRYTDMGTFLAKCRAVPRLCDLVTEARPISDEPLTATNYSMISERLCSYDEKWLLVGDAAFFVDPLFSSGVTLALSEAFSAAFVIEATLASPLSEASQRDVWSDYDVRYRMLADSLAAMVDQWYHAIGRIHPDSIYTKLRSQWPASDLREETLSTLFNLSLLDVAFDFSIPPDQRERWGRFFQTGRPLSSARWAEPGAGARVRLSEGVELRPSAFLGMGPADAPGEYWVDPVGSGDRLLPLVPFAPCHRFSRHGQPGSATVPFVDRHEHGLALYALLAQGPRDYGSLKASLLPSQERLLERLLKAELVEVVA
jgi:2-polyprenyl-6-methoxyphenol hydroxylase-like FAD-dependent oxidoreductase